MRNLGLEDYIESEVELPATDDGSLVHTPRTKRMLIWETEQNRRAERAEGE